jgi:hypothetical protein
MKKLPRQYRTRRPSREELLGYSPSEFKFVLRLNGHKVEREFFQKGCISKASGRMYRWRWWKENDGSGEFVVDVSCLLPEFDRWANSTDLIIDPKQLLKVLP